MKQNALEWIAKVGCTGGPIMLVDLPHLPQWTGAIPFRALRERSEADAVRFAGRQTVLHFWGNLGGAGDRFVECDSEEEAVAKLEGLHRLAKKNCPEVVITEKDGLTFFRDPTSGAELRAELEPKSEYDASWRPNADADAWSHSFGDHAHALFWFVGDDVIHIGRSKVGDAIVLLKHTIEKSETSTEDHAAACAHVEHQGADAPVAELSFSTGRAVALWAPVAFDELRDFEPSKAADENVTIAASLDIDGEKGIGAIFRIEPGRYVASLGSVEPSRAESRAWSARWCRLTRLT